MKIVTSWGDVCGTTQNEVVFTCKDNSLVVFFSQSGYLPRFAAMVVAAIQFCPVLHRSHQTSMGSQSTGPCFDTTIYSQCFTAAFSSKLPVKFGIVFKISLLTYKILCEKTACLSSLKACSITPILFIEIKQRNPSVGTYGQDQCRCKSISFLRHFYLEQLSAVFPFSHFSCNLQEVS